MELRKTDTRETVSLASQFGMGRGRGGGGKERIYAAYTKREGWKVNIQGERGGIRMERLARTQG